MPRSSMILAVAPRATRTAPEGDADRAAWLEHENAELKEKLATEQQAIGAPS